MLQQLQGEEKAKRSIREGVGAQVLKAGVGAPVVDDQLVPRLEALQSPFPSKSSASLSTRTQDIFLQRREREAWGGEGTDLEEVDDRVVRSGRERVVYVQKL